MYTVQITFSDKLKYIYYNIGMFVSLVYIYICRYVLSIIAHVKLWVFLEVFFGCLTGFYAEPAHLPIQRIVQ